MYMGQGVIAVCKPVSFYDLRSEWYTVNLPGSVSALGESHWPPSYPTDKIAPVEATDSRVSAQVAGP